MKYFAVTPFDIRLTPAAVDVRPATLTEGDK